LHPRIRGVTASLKKSRCDDSLPTYLFAIGKISTITDLEKEISKLEGFDTKELVTKNISNESMLLCMGKNASDNLSNPETTEFFSGWMNDHQNSCIYLGQKGFKMGVKQHQRKNLTLKEGAFIHSSWNRKEFRLQHDCFGLYPILYFQEQDVFVASDSLLCLTKIRTILNLENRVEEKVHTSRSWKHGLAKCLMSNSTVVKSIQYLPPASSIVVRPIEADQQFRLEVEKQIPKMPHVFTSESRSYHEVLEQSLREIVGTILAIQSVQGINIELGLSGGLDSRVLLAALRYNSSLAANISIRTNTHSSRSKDFDIVSRMSRKINFRFNETGLKNPNKSKIPRRIKVSNEFGNWALTNLGIFDMMYMYADYWKHPYNIQLGGHGAEIVKGTFAKMSFFKIAFRYRTPIRYLHLRRELKSALRSIGVPFRSKNKLQWHHLCYKSAIQNGRSLSQSLLALRPFMNKTMCSYGLKNPKNKLLQDLLILLDSELAVFPFDEESKNMSPEYVEARKQQLSPIDISNFSTPYQVYGDVENIQNGLLSSLLEFGKGFQTESKSIRESLLMNIENVWACIESPYERTLYQDVFTKAQQELSKQDAYIPSAGSNASKILALDLFDKTKNSD